MNDIIPAGELLETDGLVLVSYIEHPNIMKTKIMKGMIIYDMWEAIRERNKIAILVLHKITGRPLDYFSWIASLEEYEEGKYR